MPRSRIRYSCRATLHLSPRSFLALNQILLLLLVFFGGPVIDRALAVSYSLKHTQHDYRINTQGLALAGMRRLSLSLFTQSVLFSS